MKLYIPPQAASGRTGPAAAKTGFGASGMRWLVRRARHHKLAQTSQHQQPCDETNPPAISKSTSRNAYGRVSKTGKNGR